MVYTLLIISFFLSGICGLVYEVVWTRMLGLVFGTTVFAVSTVLASYMAGLALGSFFFGRYIDRHGKPLKVYALLEAGIGISALLVPFMLGRLEVVYIALYRWFNSGFYVLSAARLLASFLVLLVPATLMGATLPVVSKYFVRKYEKLSRSAGRLYGINTLGAVAGCFIAGFILIEKAGVRNTILLAGAVNLVIAAVILLVCGKAGVDGEPDEGKPEAIPVLKYSGKTGRLALAVFAVSGFCALAYEVLWSRVMVFFLTSNTYAFSMMLVTFLTGIALGSLLFAKISDRVKNPLTLLGLVEVLIGVFAVLSILYFGKINYIINKSGMDWSKWLGLRFAACFIVMFLPTFLMGGAFPLVIRIYTGSMKSIGRAVGSVYSSNTVGSIFGSLAAGFILIPLAGIQRSILVIGLINILAGCAAVLYNPLAEKKFKKIFTVSALCVAAAFVVFIPVGEPIILSSVIVQKAKNPVDILFYREDATATVTVLDVDGNRNLNIDGFNAAGTKKYEYMRMLGHLPVLLANNPEKVLVICFGTGTTCGSIYRHGVDELDCVEISPAVVEAGAYYADVNNNILDREGFNLIVDDGRNYLLCTDKEYDVITLEPMHPYLSHAVDFYSRDFYELCREKLTEDGVMCQWAPMHALSKDDYGMLLKTFIEVFPHTTMWFVGSESILIGTREELSIDFKRLKKRMGREEVKEDLRIINYDNVFALLDSFVMDEGAMDEYVKNDAVITDDRPVLEFSAPRNLTMPSGETWRENLKELNRRRKKVFPLLVNIDEGSKDKTRNILDKYFRSTGHVIKGQVLSSNRKLENAVNEYKKALELNPEDRRLPPILDSARNELKFYYFKLGTDYRKKRAYDFAFRAYQKVLEIDPGYARAHNGLAIVYNAMKMYDKSIEECRKAIELDPAVPDAYNNLGIIYMNKNLFDLAEEQFRKALDVDPGFVKAYYYLGSVSEYRGMFGEAKNRYKEAVKLDPEFERAIMALKRLDGAD